MKNTAAKTSPITKARANLIKFCGILDDLPINFSFKLDNVSKDFNGCWKKTVSDGTTAWQNGPRILFNSFFFPKRNQVLKAIEREGRSVKQLYFSDTRPKITSPLTKEKVKELYHEQKKSLAEIGKQYGYSKQWIMLLMDKYGLKRRTLSDAQKVTSNQSKKNEDKQR
jgi:hypothetical protein